MNKQLAPISEEMFQSLCAMIDIARRHVPFTTKAMNDVALLAEWLNTASNVLPTNNDETAVVVDKPQVVE